MTDERDEGRGPRAQQEAQRRRRRGDDELGADKRLPIPPEVQAWADQNDMHLRWVNDEGNRMHRFTQRDDYDPVPNVEPVPVGTQDGVSIKAHLLAKPKAFKREDEARAEARRKANEEALFRDPNAAAAASKKPQPGGAETFMTESSGIRRGNQVLE